MHDGSGPDLVDLRKKGFVDAEAAWECDWWDSGMRRRADTGDVTWAETAFAKPNDYAPHVADALNGIAEEHPEMGLRNTVVLTPHTVDLGAVNDVLDWVRGRVLGYEEVAFEFSDGRDYNTTARMIKQRKIR